MIFELPQDQIWFPEPHLAEEDGLLAIGGDLSPERLMLAYQKGIFPWYSDETPILWYSPHERFVLFPKKLKISKSLRKVLKQQQFNFSVNRNFKAVIQACASVPREGQDGTWITSEMENAYIALNHLGYAHSVEAWENGKLAGGLYGVEVNGTFCGESMFSRISNASKAALAELCNSGRYEMVDCQIYSEHLAGMGAELISRDLYLSLLHGKPDN